jgi:hypothetical protein
MSIYRKIQQAKTNPDTARTGSYWSQEEDDKLIESVLSDTPLAKIALDHQRTTGGIELRIRSLAYNEYESLSCVDDSKNESIVKIAEKFRINVDDFGMFVRDKERYKITKNKEKEIKNEEKRKAKELKDEEERLVKEAREEEKRKVKEAREEEKRKVKEAREMEEIRKTLQKQEVIRLKEENDKKLKEAKEEQKKIKEDEDKMEHNYIYCLREREFIRSGENIFKVGKTTVHPFQRVKQYPNGSQIVLILKVSNCHIAEQELLKFMDKKFKPAIIDGQRVGREYYEGLENEMIQSIFECLVKF